VKASSNSSLGRLQPHLAAKIQRQRSSIVAWGGVAAVGFVLVLALGAGVVPLEERVEAPVNTQVAGAALAVMAPSTGDLAFIAPSSRFVSAGTTLVVLGRPGDAGRLAELETYLGAVGDDLASNSSTLTTWSGGSSGVFEAELGALVQAVAEWNNYAVEQPDRRTQEQQNARQRTAHAQMAAIRNQMPLLRESAALTQEKLRARRGLVERGFGSTASLNDLQQEAISSQLQIVELQERLATSEGQIFEAAALAEAADLRARSAVQRLKADVVASLTRANASLGAWRRLNVVTAPQDGVFEPFERREASDHVVSGQQLGTLLRPQAGIMVAAFVPAQDAGDIEKGQYARVYLDNLPRREHGFLKGRVLSKSAYLQNGSYYVEIDLLSPNRTSAGSAADLSPGMPGVVEVVTGRRSALTTILREGLGWWRGRR